MVRFAAEPRPLRSPMRTLAVGHIRHGRRRMVVVPRTSAAPFPGPWEVRAVVLVS